MESQFIKRIKNIYFWACMIYITGATFLVEIDWLLIPVTLFGYYCFYMKKQKWDNFIIYILLAYTLISFGSWAYNGGEEFSITAFIGFYFRILIPYFLIKVFGFSFFYKFEKVVYYGALISLPFFVVSIIDPFFYTNNLASINLSTELRESVGYWNCILYTTHGGGMSIRNDGFAVEPGHFGYLLGVAIFFNFLFNSFKINKRLIVMLIAGLTTVSTTFYLTLGLFLYLYNLNVRTSMLFKFCIFIFSAVVCFYIATSSLIVDKINKTQVQKKNQFEYGYSNIEHGESMNRFSQINVGLYNLKNYPLGYSVNSTGKLHALDGTVVFGPNGLVSFIVFWGLGGLIFLIFALFKLSNFFIVNYQYKKGKYLFVLILIMFLFSNSVSRDILLFSLIMLPFINKEAKLIKLTI